MEYVLLPLVHQLHKRVTYHVLPDLTLKQIQIWLERFVFVNVTDDGGMACQV